MEDQCTIDYRRYTITINYFVPSYVRLLWVPYIVYLRCFHIILLFLMCAHRYESLLVVTDVNINNQWEKLWTPFIEFLIWLISSSHWQLLRSCHICSESPSELSVLEITLIYAFLFWPSINRCCYHQCRMNEMFLEWETFSPEISW